MSVKKAYIEWLNSIVEFNNQNLFTYGLMDYSNRPHLTNCIDVIFNHLLLFLNRLFYMVQDML